jgi:cardiolipin synthase
MNLVDADFKRRLTYEEMMVRVTGPIVLLQAVFVEDWYLSRGGRRNPATRSGSEITGSVAARVSSSPLYLDNNQRLIVALVNGARTRAVITTPYSFRISRCCRHPPPPMRGVDVRPSSPRRHQPSSPMRKNPTTGTLGAGVRICRYGKRFSTRST